MKILAIGYVWPEPNSSAAGKHMLSLLSLFGSQGWQVHFASPAQRSTHQIDLTDLGFTEHEISLNCSSFDDFISTFAPDLVIFDRFMLEEQFGWRVAKHCPDAIRILDTEDLHFLRNARHAAHKQKRQLTQSDLQSDMAAREIAAIYRCDLSLIISDFELSLLKNTFSVPEQLLNHTPFILPASKESSSLPSFQQRFGFISIGNFRHEPNWDAVLWLKQEIWPAIRKQLPQAELHIYGAYPPPKATQLHNKQQGFLVKGWVEDAEEAMSAARVCLAPLRFGAGIKGKLTEAMQCGTPSVTTPIGAEGMQGTCPWPGVVSDNIADFVNAAVSLYSDQLAWDKARQQAPLLLAEKFDRSTITKDLIDRITSIQADLNAHRMTNFTGKMLMHHSMKSTQYMAQWIEAKNKVSQ